jgi:hypothetical protein
MKDTVRFMTSKWLLPVLVCLVFACGKAKKPKDILSRAEMVRVIMDIYLTEEKMNRTGVPRDSAVKLFDITRSRMFEKAGVKDSTFNTSFRYYVDHPKELEQIYTAVVDSLQLREQRASTKPL